MLNLFGGKICVIIVRYRENTVVLSCASTVAHISYRLRFVFLTCRLDSKEQAPRWWGRYYSRETTEQQQPTALAHLQHQAQCTLHCHESRLVCHLPYDFHFHNLSLTRSMTLPGVDIYDDSWLWIRKFIRTIDGTCCGDFRHKLWGDNLGFWNLCQVSIRLCSSRFQQSNDHTIQRRC